MITWPEVLLAAGKKCSPLWFRGPVWKKAARWWLGVSGLHLGCHCLGALHWCDPVGGEGSGQ